MCLRRTVITLIYCGFVIASAKNDSEVDARAGVGDDLSDSTGHPKIGDIPLLNRKIIKGQRVTIREHPYVASVRRKFSHYISGALLSNNLVVTVAHPLVNVPIFELGIVLGENYSDRGSTVMTVVLKVFHRQFDPFTLKDDIALLRTYEEVGFRGAIKPIKLISPTTTLHELKAFVTGWGRCDSMGTELCLSRGSMYFPDEKLDPMLRTVTFSIVHPLEKCIDYKRYDITLYPGMLCLGESREEEHACPCLAAPGAPLVTSTNLVGIQSWGYGCGYLTDLPLVYVDIQYYIPWLLQNIIILRHINQQNLTALFEATKAAVLFEWLTETRIIKPRIEFRNEKTMERLNIDAILFKINGSVYDIRDYINDGAYHKEKVSMYDNFMLIAENEVPRVRFYSTTTKMEAKAFLGVDAIIIAYNKNDLTSSKADKELRNITTFKPPIHPDPDKDADDYY